MKFEESGTVQNQIKNLIIAQLLLGCLFSIAAIGIEAKSNANSRGLFHLDIEELAQLSLETAIRSPMGVHHTLAEGLFCLCYNHGYMEMNDNLAGSDSISTDAILDEFRITPTDMSMQSHMVNAMYGLTKDITVMAMLPWKRKSMNHLTRSGTRFKTKSEGVGDLKLTMFYTPYRGKTSQLFINTSLYVPTGAISKKDKTPLGRVVLPYPMQLGSGTFDPEFGFTAIKFISDWTVGVRTDYVFRLGHNYRGYRLGNKFKGQAWVSYRMKPRTTPYLRLNATDWGDIKGMDDDLDPTLVPTADPNRRGGTRVDLLAGVNIFGDDALYKGPRLTAEVGTPIYQYLDGQQLETEWMANFIFMWSF